MPSPPQAPQARTTPQQSHHKAIPSKSTKSVVAHDAGDATAEDPGVLGRGGPQRSGRPASVPQKRIGVSVQQSSPEIVPHANVGTVARRMAPARKARESTIQLDGSVDSDDGDTGVPSQKGSVKRKRASEEGAKKLAKSISSKQGTSARPHESQSRGAARHAQPAPDAEPNDDLEEEQYEVEAIIGKKGSGPTVQYLVKWLGYDERSWQYAWDLDNCMDLVAKFEKTEEEKKQAEFKKKQAELKKSLNQNTGMKSARLISQLTPSGSRKTSSANPEVVSARDESQTPSVSSSVSSRLLACNHVAEPSPRHQQMHFAVALPGESGIELGHNVVGILAHKPKQLVAHCMEDVDFLVNYAGEAPNEFVAYEVCIRKIPTHVADYLSRNTVLSFGRGH